MKVVSFKETLSSLGYARCLFLLFVCFVSFYYGLDSYPLLNNNEGLYGTIAKEMLMSSQKVIPTLNGVPYIEKPPLLYWLVALSFKIFGVSTFAARFVPATASVLLVVSLLNFGGRLKKPELGFLSAFILASSVGFAILSRMVFFESLLTALLSGALLLFYLWYVDEKRSYLFLSYAALALAALTKGFVAIVLFGGVICCFLLKEKNLQKFLKLFDPLALLIFFGLFLPWHLFAVFYEPGFAWFYFINEHVLRFLDLREPRDYYHGPFYYYVPRVLALTLPWFAFLGRGKKPSRPIDAKLKSFCWVWFLFFLSFFSLSRAKANYYMVTSLVPLSLIMAFHLLEGSRRVLNIQLFINFGLTLSILGGLIWAIHSLEPLAVLKDYKVYSMPFSYYLYGGGLIIFLCFLSDYLFKSVLSPPVASLVLIFCILKGIIPLKAEVSGEPLAKIILNQGPGDKVLFYKNYEDLSALPFYLQQPIWMVESESADLNYGKSVKPEKFLSSLEAEFLCQGEVCYLVLLKKWLDDFQSTSLSKMFCEVTHFGKTYLFSNKCPLIMEN